MRTLHTPSCPPCHLSSSVGLLRRVIPQPNGTSRPRITTPQRARLLVQCLSWRMASTPYGSRNLSSPHARCHCCTEYTHPELSVQASVAWNAIQPHLLVTE